MKRRTFLAGLAGGMAAAGIACSRRTQRLNVFNWSDYVAPDTISNFEKETGAWVRYGTYESVPEMLAKVLTGNSGWDVAFPSAEYIAPMRDMGLLAPLRHDWLPEMGNLDAPFQRPPWDPDLRWSIPYMHGATGIVYQQSLRPAPASWSDLWAERMSGKITMLDDPSEVFAAALKMLGYSINSADSEQLKKAQQAAIRQKHLLRAYLNAEVRDQLVAGDIAAAQAWAVTAGQAMAAAPGRLDFSFPSEGFPRFADNVVLLKESSRPELAHRFINYLLRASVAAQIAVFVQTATCNRAAYELLPESTRRHPVLYPPPHTLARGEWFEPQAGSSQRLRDRLWTEIKST